MRVASIAAGAAGMYCGTCIHDNTLAAALQRAGHEVALLPLYTPMRTDEDNVSLRQVFYGAVNVYLQQKSGIFRHTPRVLDRLLDRPALLNQVSRLAASTDAAELGDLTLSVLRAEDGKQVKELDRLISWLREFKPQVVQVAYSMLLGIGSEIKRQLGVPIVCGLTGEDLFLDYLPEPHRTRVADEMRLKARQADAFVATSRYYAGQMQEFLQIPAERMHVVHLGINLNFVGTNHLERDNSGPLIIGYMARICPEKGLHILLEAFRLLLERRPQANLKLRVAGYVGARDEPYLAEQKRLIKDWGIDDHIEILGEVDLEGKRELLSSADIVSVPTTYREPKGLFVLEALAHGVPVVQPAHGAFPELMEATGGGLLVEPDSPSALADGLQQLVDDPKERSAMGRRGTQAVREHFNSDRMAARTLEIYQQVVRNQTSKGQ
jgi:glycosyltransferase involved in cell wall biosynthesis